MLLAVMHFSLEMKNLFNKLVNSQAKFVLLTIYVL